MAIATHVLLSIYESGNNCSKLHIVGNVTCLAWSCDLNNYYLKPTVNLGDA